LITSPTLYRNTTTSPSLRSKYTKNTFATGIPLLVEGKEIGKKGGKRGKTGKKKEMGNTPK